jgi:hypothetical protein
MKLSAEQLNNIREMADAMDLYPLTKGNLKVEFWDEGEDHMELEWFDTLQSRVMPVRTTKLTKEVARQKYKQLLNEGYKKVD